MSITITEALSELNLIKKKIEKKRQAISGLVIKAKQNKDPMETEGGSKIFIAREVQAINDLQSRFIALKGAIAAANNATIVTIDTVKMSIHEWLIWKRDIADLDIKFYKTVYDNVNGQFSRLQMQPQVYKDEAGATHLLEYESQIDQAEFLKKQESLNDMLEKLDGQLSLKNATITVNL